MTNILDIAIVDYGIGNLFSIQKACEQVGLVAHITSSAPEILGARAVILPGVGAFGDAMETLKKLNLVTVIKEVASSGKPLVGICLGMQLLMTESYEFGHHLGLNLITGIVQRFDQPHKSQKTLKVPQVGWNRIYKTDIEKDGDGLLSSIAEGEFMYFVHSYYVVPQNPTVWSSKSRYGSIEFCSSLRQGNIYAFQFHPERSGAKGLTIYRKLAQKIYS